MQGSQLDPRGTAGSPSFGDPHASVDSSRRAENEFKRQHDDFLKRAVMVEAGPGHTVLDLGAAMPKSQGFEAEPMGVRLAAENDQLRVERALLLAQLAARDAEIRDLKARLPSEADEDEVEALPHRKPNGSFRARSKLGTVRRGVAFIHPDDLVVEDE